MVLVIDVRGQLRGLYQEDLDLSSLGEATVRRASHVEPDAIGQWFADLTPIGGPTLGPYPSRTAALRAEVSWIEQHLAARP